MSGIEELRTITTGRGKVKNFLMFASYFVTPQVSRYAQPQARQVMLADTLFIHLFHSAFAAHALFGLCGASLIIGARFLRLRYAADLRSYNPVFQNLCPPTITGDMPR